MKTGHLNKYNIEVISMKEKRSELPDSVFGIPSQRKYPMQDREHVLSAIKFFNYVDEDHEKELAENIIKKMKEYKIPFDTVGEKNRLRNYIPKKYLEEASNLATVRKTIKFQKKVKDYYKKMGIKGPNGLADLIKVKGYNAGMIAVVNTETDLEFLKYIRSDTRTCITTLEVIRPRVDKCIRLGDCKETHSYYKAINKLYVSKGITPRDIDITIKGEQRMCDEITERIKVVRKMIRDGTIKEDATGNAMVGTNQPDSVYIVNYMKRNSFSGELEEHKGVCKKDMKNIHIFSKSKKKMIPISLSEFASSIVGDIRLEETGCTDFIGVVRNAVCENDIAFLTSSESILGEAASFTKQTNLLQEIQIYVDAEQRELDKYRYDHLYEMACIENYIIGRQYNYYTDIAGTFIRNELDGRRSASYPNIQSIPEAVKHMIMK